MSVPEDTRHAGGWRGREGGACGEEEAWGGKLCPWARCGAWGKSPPLPGPHLPQHLEVENCVGSGASSEPLLMICELWSQINLWAYVFSCVKLDNDIIYRFGLLWRLTEVMHVKWNTLSCTCKALRSSYCKQCCCCCWRWLYWASLMGFKPSNIKPFFWLIWDSSVWRGHIELFLWKQVETLGPGPQHPPSPGLSQPLGSRNHSWQQLSQRTLRSLSATLLNPLLPSETSGSICKMCPLRLNAFPKGFIWARPQGQSGQGKPKWAQGVRKLMSDNCDWKDSSATNITPRVQSIGFYLRSFTYCDLFHCPSKWNSSSKAWVKTYLQDRPFSKIPCLMQMFYPSALSQFSSWASLISTWI